MERNDTIFVGVSELRLHDGDACADQIATFGDLIHRVLQRRTLSVSPLELKEKRKRKRKKKGKKGKKEEKEKENKKKKEKEVFRLLRQEHSSRRSHTSSSLNKNFISISVLAE